MKLLCGRFSSSSPKPCFADDDKYFRNIFLAYRQWLRGAVVDATGSKYNDVTFASLIGHIPQELLSIRHHKEKLIIASYR